MQAPIMQAHGDGGTARPIAHAMPFAARVDQRQLTALDNSPQKSRQKHVQPPNA